MNTKLLSGLLACLITGIAYAQFPPPPQTVGVPTQVMHFIAAGQEGSQWCWAASIEMVLRRYGVSISQRKIVARSYGTDPFGNLPDWAGSWEVITANLNNWDLDEFTGQPYQVTCEYGNGAPEPRVLVNELANGCPIVAAYQSGPSSGHAVVITGVRYYPTDAGPDVVSIIVRDPWPSPENVATRGLREYPSVEFAQVMQGYWLVRVQKP